MQKSRWIIIIVISMAVIFAIAYGFMPRPVPVDIVKASRGPLTVTIEEEGRTRVKDRFVISAPVSGLMRRIELDVGGHVKKGQVVVKLEPLMPDMLDPRSFATAKAAVSAAEASLKAAEENARARAADAEYAIANFERIKKLYEEGLVSRNMMERTASEAKRAEANHLSAAATANAARYELKKARTALRHYPSDAEANNRRRIVYVRSPANGRILNIHRKSEGVVVSGEPLIDIGNPSLLEVVVEALSSDAVKIKPGMPVLFERWGGKPVLYGTVRIVEPAGFAKISPLGVEEQRVLVIADIISPPEKWRMLLSDGFRMDVRFIIWEGEDVMQIPAGALFRKIEDWAVFVVKNNRAYHRRVEIGHRTGLFAEIISGIDEGEKVIVHPDERIRDGVQVRVR
jgi:HlyD family secretion protein